MSVRMRHTNSHTGNRRSHHAVKPSEVQLCVECKAPKLPHRVCLACGKYKKVEMINVFKKVEKEKKREAKMKTLREAYEARLKELKEKDKEKEVEKKKSKKAEEKSKA